jgi:hypothetical protein
MKSGNKNSATGLAVLAVLIACATANAQVDPAATGSSAILDYDLSYSQTALFYAGYSDAQQRGTAAGEVEYMNGKPHTPFSLKYSGGYSIGISGSESGTGVFQHLLISQGYTTRRSSVTLSDDVGYYPQSPTTGFSGIPGVGSIPGLPGEPTEPILTLNTRCLNNTATLNFTHSLNYDTSFSAAGDYVWLRFPDGGGLDINEVGAHPQINWRLNALNSVFVQYSFTRFNYIGSPFVMETQTVEPGLHRVWNRRITTDVSAGPELIQSNNDQVVPSSIGIAANASVTYTGRLMTASANYYRTVSAGAGLQTQIGVRYNGASVDVSRTFGRDMTIGATGSYTQTAGLLQTGDTNGEFGGVNATRRLGEYLTVSGNYTVFHQSSSLALPTSALHGLSQVIGFSVAYHPRETHIVRQ